jgi:hypothetical protein
MEEAAVHNMRAWQEEPVASQEMTVASLKYKEPTSKDIESEAERQKVPTEEAAVKSSRVMKKRQGPASSRRATQRAKRTDPKGLGIPREVGCRLQEVVPPCGSGMA